MDASTNASEPQWWSVRAHHRPPRSFIIGARRQPRGSRNSMSTREHSLGDTSSRQDMRRRVSEHKWGSLETPQKSLEETWVSTIAPWSFVLLGCSSLGTSRLNREHSFIPFQGSHDSYLCFEIQRIWTLEIITGFYTLQSNLQNCLSSFISPQ